MIFRQLFDYETWTYTYLIADEKTREAALIDSVAERSERDAQLLKDLGLNLKYLMETHVHADHITGVARMKKHFPAALSVVSEAGGAPCADILTQAGEVYTLGELEIKVLSTPGHTNGCVSYLMEDRVFTGDALFIRGTGRTDFQQGDAGKLYDGITQKLFTLPDATWVYPGHDYAGNLVSTIGEEKRLNPRLAGKSREEFIALMANLNLPHPKKIAESVPANLRCGSETALAVALN
jgi:sulfur dioxygenase